VQRLLGISDRVGQGGVGANGSSVRIELQADCYAGMWARSTAQRALLEQGDLESAINAASRIGDDVMQRQTTGRVRPESFTHGSSAQRRRWLRRGYDTGSLEACDTLQAPAL
jgi:predicted metalloprotease